MTARTSLPLLLLAVAAAAAPAAAAEPVGEPLFDGESFEGWFFAPHTDPRAIAAMTPADRAAFFAEHAAAGRGHWTIETGDGGPELVCDGGGPYLWTDRDFADFELSLDWKIAPGTDSGVYVRGCPQVQIWDPAAETKHRNDLGSGGLWNNPAEGPNARGKDPAELADNPPGEWNAMTVRVVGASVTVHLNGVRVVTEATLENYWDRALPLFPVGPIILQTHGGETRWRNLAIREIPRAMPEGGYISDTGPTGDGWKEPGGRLTVVPPAGAAHATVGPLENGRADLTALVRTGEPAVPVRFTFLPDDITVDNPLARLAALAPDGSPPADDAADAGPVPGLQIDLDAAKRAFDAGTTNFVYASNAVGTLTLYLNGVPFLDAVAADGQAAGANPFGVTGDGQLLGVRWPEGSRELIRASAPAPPADETGFEPVPLTPELPGWTGDTGGYEAAGGILTCRGGGNVYLPGEHENFALRFEFKLPPGGNNGVGLRCERGEDAAYHGMESQILDNTAAAFRDLKPYQYHGSIYGVAAAQRGALNPVGHWNAEEIVCDGDRVTVTLNGTRIVDANVRELAEGGTADGKPHPGLLNARGAVGFLGHGAPVAWRNVRIKPLPAGDATAAADPGASE